MTVALDRFWAIAARVTGLPLWAGLAPAHAAPAPTDPYPLEAACWGPEAGNGPFFSAVGPRTGPTDSSAERRVPDWLAAVSTGRHFAATMTLDGRLHPLARVGDLCRW